MKIALIGDVALIGKYNIENNKQVNDYFVEVKKILDKCDYVIANLETPLTLKKHTLVCKGVYLKSSPESVSILKNLNITHVNLANNHIFDYGKKGMADTLKCLNANNIKYVGIGNNPCLIEKDEEKVSLNGFCCYSANGVFYGNNANSLNVLIPEKVQEFIEKSDKEGVLPIASIHFGVEGVNYPSFEHRKLFRELTKIGRYVLHGHHPHVIQGYENLYDSFLVYSQGNFVFDDLTKTTIGQIHRIGLENKETFITILTIKDCRVIEKEIIPITVDECGKLVVNEAVNGKIELFSKNLLQEETAYYTFREKKMITLSSDKSNRDIKFYLKRLNIKYMLAFLNGKIHSKKYNRYFRSYMKK